MPTWTRTIWIAAIIVNGLSIVWFLFGTTANFQRALDLTGRLTLIFFWLPSLILVLLSIWLLHKRWDPLGGFGYGIVAFLIFLLLIFSCPLFEGVRTSGWLYEDVRADPTRLTMDGKLEYHLEIVNLYQRNSRERLFVKLISTGEEKNIPLDINATEADGLSIGRSHWGWVTMLPTEIPNQYLLNTTEYLDMPEKKFLINIENGTSKRIN
ncbi:hypothetical protein M3201_00045 [Paenibacillus motobuensis]|uniref:hypothetical protein n=1 Tax=Paenibacillus TaxID=44249 RepID=UPI00203D236F|nr:MULTISPECIES: hypothetical protein [Paenibacillus]MCM3038094.1 hypothetical protein [Paenibacillus lutimineralis]MCM3645198.1 hypothetical protein [Paenibacillus motobuensis]